MRSIASLTCGVAFLCAPITAMSATRYTPYVQPGAGTTERDGAVYGAGGAFTEPNGTIGFSGRYGGASMWMVAKFKLSDFLPPGTTAAQIGHAYLSVPYTDVLWVGDPFTNMDLVLHHFATTNNTTIASADHDSNTPALTNYGIVIPHHTRSVNRTRKIIVDVTAAIQDDLNNARVLSSFRVGADPSGDLSTNDYTYFATADNTDTFFGPLAPFSGRNILKLIVLVGTPEICNNNLDDDGDGLTDCDDKDECDDLFNQQPCHETTCNDGQDNDFDGEVDCDDSDCFGKPGCNTVETNCRDAQDNDGDARVDCADSNCFGQAGCTRERICNDGFDNDSDGLTDCTDPDCVGRTGCTNEATAPGYCNDSSDNDFDCLADGSDPDCAATGVVIKPLSAQDDTYLVALNTFQGPTSTFWTYGQYNGQPMAALAEITIPPGTDPNSIGKALLDIPNTDVLWFVEPANPAASVSAMNLVAYHIDAADDTQVTAPDATVTPLGTLGVYRAPGPRVQSGARFTELDVTQAVKDDINAGRATFAFRIQFDAPPAVSDIAAYYSPSVDSTDGFFPASNRGARLRLLLPGTFESSCTDATDNDGDGKIDCQDADCYGNVACGTEICKNGIDDDHDGLTDCADADCVAAACCQPAETGATLCGNSIDDDLDGLTDCLDPGCNAAAPCNETGTQCKDGLDNDGDGVIDCADPGCASYPLCQYAKPFADADHDGDVDQDDFARLQKCFAGSGVALLNTGCARWDRDVDNDVDQDDYNAFKACTTGSGVILNVANPPVGCNP
jgi:hypothetical protein